MNFDVALPRARWRRGGRGPRGSSRERPQPDLPRAQRDRLGLRRVHRSRRADALGALPAHAEGDRGAAGADPLRSRRRRADHRRRPGRRRCLRVSAGIGAGGSGERIDAARATLEQERSERLAGVNAAIAERRAAAAAEVEQARAAAQVDGEMAVRDVAAAAGRLATGRQPDDDAVAEAVSAVMSAGVSAMNRLTSAVGRRHATLPSSRSTASTTRATPPITRCGPSRPRSSTVASPR